jgi:hypothetical protein
MDCALFAPRFRLGFGAAIITVAVAGGCAAGCQPGPATGKGQPDTNNPPTSTTAQRGTTPSSLASPPAALVEEIEAEAEAFPAQLVRDVKELIRLTAEYNSLAAKVQSRDDYRRKAATLEAREKRLSVFVARVTAAEARLSKSQREAFDRRYFASRARPLIEEKRAHQRRIQQLLE